MMKVNFDKEANAMYIYFKEISQGEIAKTISLNDNVNLDLDKNGRTIGIEILDASKNLPSSAITSALSTNI